MSTWRGCTRPDCPRPERCRGLCARHYNAARYAGTLNAQPRRRERTPQARCTIADCTRGAVCRGLCDGHAKQERARAAARAPRPGAVGGA